MWLHLVTTRVNHDGLEGPTTDTKDSTRTRRTPRVTNVGSLLTATRMHLNRLLPGALAFAVALSACADQSVGPSAADGGTGTSGSDAFDPSAPLSLASAEAADIVVGESTVLRGTGFAPTLADNVVTVAGVPLTVSAVTGTSITVTAPSSGFACEPAREATLAVTVRGKTVTRSVALRAARPVTMSPGAGVVLGDGIRCIELPTAGSRYVVAVVNASRVAGATAPFELRGRTSTTASAAAAPVALSHADASAPVPASGDAARAPFGDDAEILRRRERLHHRILETSRGLRARFGAPGRDQAGAQYSLSPDGTAATAAAGPTAGLQAPGDTATLRIPDINASNACGKYFSVRTRVVYSGQRAILLEDVTAPLAGRMDDTYRSIGEEFERVMWPVLTASFGNPLAMDSRLDRNGRIIMLFSPVVNNNFAGIAGFVIGCDFYPRTQALSSNEGEVFYATVPTSTFGGLSSVQSPEGWRRSMRSTIIHEAKHITSFAERMSRGSGLEEGWLEEGTARHSEELYARVLSSSAWKANSGYAAIACDVRPSTTACADRPYVMYKHFSGLADYMAANGTLTPLGQTSTSDYNYYASAWSLVRWATDLAPAEGAFLQGLTRGPLTGVANLEAATGRTWADMLADWTMSLALDDATGFVPARDQRIATWNLHSVFAGMHSDFPATYTRPHPLVAHPASFGSFAVQGSALRGGSASLVDLTGAWAGPQVLEMRLPGGGTPSGSLRLAVTKVN